MLFRLQERAKTLGRSRWYTKRPSEAKFKGHEIQNVAPNFGQLTSPKMHKGPRKKEVRQSANIVRSLCSLVSRTEQSVTLWIGSAVGGAASRALECKLEQRIAGLNRWKESTEIREREGLPSEVMNFIKSFKS